MVLGLLPKQRAMATLSVFMPNYNHGHLLPRAIEAIVSQSRQPDEFVIIDDGSTDGSVEIIKGCQKKFPFIELIQHTTNRGLMAILEYIPDRLRGEYIFGASADDYVLPGFFEAAINVAERYPQAGIIFGQMVVVNAAGKELYVGGASAWSQSRYASPEEYRREFLEVEPPGHALTASLVYKKSSLLAVGGFRPELGAWSDVFAARAIGLREGAVYIPQRCAVWTVQKDSISHQTRKSLRQSLAMVSKASALMRSPEFRKYFPEVHVRRWARLYRISVLSRYFLSSVPCMYSPRPGTYYKLARTLSTRREQKL